MSLLKKLLGKDKLSKYEVEQKKRYKQYVKLGTTNTIVLSKSESEIYQDYFVRKMSSRRGKRKVAAPRKPPENQIDIFKEPSTNTLSAAPAVLDAVNKNVAINPIPEQYLADLKQFEAFKVQEDVPTAIIQSQQQTQGTSEDCQTNTVNTKPLDTKFSYGNQEQFLDKLDQVIRNRNKGESGNVTKNEIAQNNVHEDRQSFEEENEDTPVAKPRKKVTKKKQEIQSEETMENDTLQKDEADGTRLQENVDTLSEEVEMVTQNWQDRTDYYQSENEELIWRTPSNNTDVANESRSNSCITSQSDDSFFDCLSEDGDIYGDGERNIMKQISPHFKHYDDKIDPKSFDSEDLFDQEFLNPPKYNTISDEVPIQGKTDNQAVQHDLLIDQQSSFTNNKVDDTDVLLENSMEPDSLEITINSTLINHHHSRPINNNVSDWARPIQVIESDFVFKEGSRENAYEFVEVQRQNEALFLDENYKPQQTMSNFVGDPEFSKIFEKPRSNKNHLIKVENNNDYSDIEMDNCKGEGKKVTFDFAKSYCQRYEADNDPEEKELVDPNLFATLTKEKGQVFTPIDNEVYFEIYHNRQNRKKKPQIHPKNVEIPNDDRSQIFLSYGVQLSPTENIKTFKKLNNMDVAFLNCKDGFDMHIRHPEPTSSIKIVELIDEDDDNDHDDVQNVHKSNRGTNESFVNNKTNSEPIHPTAPLKRHTNWGDLSNKDEYNNVQDQNSIFRGKQFDNNNNNYYNDQNVNESRRDVNESVTSDEESTETIHTKASLIHSTTWKDYALLGENGYNIENQRSTTFNEQNREQSNNFKENTTLPLEEEEKACEKEDGEDFEVIALNDISHEMLQGNKLCEFTQPITLIEHNTTNTNITNENIYKEKGHPVSKAEDLQLDMEEQGIREKGNVNYSQELGYAQNAMQYVPSMESNPTSHEQDYHQQGKNGQLEDFNHTRNTNKKHTEEMTSSIPDQTFHINYSHKLNETATSGDSLVSENKVHHNSNARSLKRDLLSPLPKDDETKSESTHSPNHFTKQTIFGDYHNNSGLESSKDSQSPKEKHESTKYSIETIPPSIPNQMSISYLRNLRQSPGSTETRSFFGDDYETSNSKSLRNTELLEGDKVVKQNTEYSRKSPSSPSQNLAVGYSYDFVQSSTSRNKDSIPETVHEITQDSVSARRHSTFEDDTMYPQNFSDFKQSPTSTEEFFVKDSNRVSNALQFSFPEEESLNENQRKTNSPKYSGDFTTKKGAPESFKKNYQLSSPKENKTPDDNNKYSMESVSPNQIFTSKYSRKFFEPSLSVEYTSISETKPTSEVHHISLSHHEENMSLENKIEPKTSKYFENQAVNRSTSPPSEISNIRNKNIRNEKATPRNPLSKIFGRSVSHNHVSPNHTYQKPHDNASSSLDRKLLRKYDEVVKNYEKDEKGEQASNEPIENKQHPLQYVKEVQTRHDDTSPSLDRKLPRKDDEDAKNCEKDEKEEQTSNKPIKSKQHPLQSIKEAQRRLSEVRNIKNVAEQLVVMQDILLNLQRRADILESRTDDEYILLLQSLFKSVRIVSGLQCNFDENLLHSQQTTLRDIKACINELNLK